MSKFHFWWCFSHHMKYKFVSLLNLARTVAKYACISFSRAAFVTLVWIFEMVSVIGHRSRPPCRSLSRRFCCFLMNWTLSWHLFVVKRYPVSDGSTNLFSFYRFVDKTDLMVWRAMAHGSSARLIVMIEAWQFENSTIFNGWFILFRAATVRLVKVLDRQDANFFQ